MIGEELGCQAIIARELLFVLPTSNDRYVTTWPANTHSRLVTLSTLSYDNTNVRCVTQATLVKTLPLTVACHSRCTNCRLVERPSVVTAAARVRLALADAGTLIPHRWSNTFHCSSVIFWFDSRACQLEERLTAMNVSQSHHWQA